MYVQVANVVEKSLTFLLHRLLRALLARSDGILSRGRGPHALVAGLRDGLWPWEAHKSSVRSFNFTLLIHLVKTPSLHNLALLPFCLLIPIACADSELLSSL